MVQREDITSQVDGVTDVFTTNLSYRPGSLMIGYNGQVWPKGRNIAEEVSSTTFRLNFIPDPEFTDALMVIYDDNTTVDNTSTMSASGMPPGRC